MVHIQFNAAWCKPLKTALADPSPAYTALVWGEDHCRLDGLMNMPDQVGVTCDHAGAQALLAAATRVCPQAIYDIRIAIHEAKAAGD